MGRVVEKGTKAEQVRAFLVAQPTWTAQQIADKVGTERSYVYNVKDRLRHEGKAKVPDRRPGKFHQVKASPTGGGEQVATTSVSTPSSATGIRFVMVERSHRIGGEVKRAPKGWRHDCGASGAGPAPEKCPKCGGA